MIPADPRMSTREAAEWLGLQPRTLEKWRARCKGPRYLKIASKVVYRLSDLESFVREVETSDSQTASR